jgi:hypothetical protein
MAEYVKRWDVSNACYDIFEEVVREGKAMTAEEVRQTMLRFEKAIRQTATADVVEVVRCKACMYAERLREEERSIYKKDVVVCSRCLTLDNKRPGDWYCPEGAKMDSTPKERGEI